MPSLLVPDVTARTSEPNGDPEEPPAEAEAGNPQAAAAAYGKVRMLNPKLSVTGQ